MRKLFFAVALLLAPAVWAQDCTGGQNFTPVTFNSEKITVSSTGLGFTAATYAPAGQQPAIRAYFSVETDSIRFLVGQVPTATTGVLVAAGSYVSVCQSDIPRFLMIRVTADATVNVIYQRAPN